MLTHVADLEYPLEPWELTECYKHGGVVGRNEDLLPGLFVIAGIDECTGNSLHNAHASGC